MKFKEMPFNFRIILAATGLTLTAIFLFMWIFRYEYNFQKGAVTAVNRYSGAVYHCHPHASEAWETKVGQCIGSDGKRYNKLP